MEGFGGWSLELGFSVWVQWFGLMSGLGTGVPGREPSKKDPARAGSVLACILAVGSWGLWSGLFFHYNASQRAMFFSIISDISCKSFLSAAPVSSIR